MMDWVTIGDISNADIWVMAGLIITALVAIWPIKKLVKLGNRT